jgi:hypothetical protein
MLGGLCESNLSRIDSSTDGSGIARFAGEGKSLHHGSQTRQELADQFGVSPSTLERVGTILFS